MIHKTDAIVLKTQPLRSSSLIVTFLTRSFGKLKGVVKGVRKEREARSAFYELFTGLEIIFYEKTRSDLHLVSDAAVIETNDHLRTELTSIAYASYFSELADGFLEIHDPHESVFELMKFCFKYLPSIDPERISRIYETKLLREIGLLPYLDECLECHVQVPDTGFFSVAQGAVYCLKCRSRVNDARLISAEALAGLRYFTRHEPAECLRFRTSQLTDRELAALMERFFLYRLGQPLKSRRFMAEIQPFLK